MRRASARPQEDKVHLGGKKQKRQSELKGTGGAAEAELIARELHTPREIAVIREKVRCRVFLVRQVTKLKVKIRDALAYEGVKPPMASASSR
jgi:hypothetical protein